MYQQEESQSIRVEQELINKNNVATTPTDTPKPVGKKLFRRNQEEKSNSHFARTFSKDNRIRSAY